MGELSVRCYLTCGGLREKFSQVIFGSFDPKALPLKGEVTTLLICNVFIVSTVHNQKEAARYYSETIGPN